MVKEKSIFADTPQAEDDLRQLVLKNIEATEALQKSVNKILRSMRFKLIFSIAWVFILVIAPTIVAFLYLPQFMEQYMNYLQTIGGLTKGL
jgi:hypothetical protein